ncbi:MAG TPA: cache domain-containing protein, partial [Bacillota bacterium]|nr:cache domain-containing protein [Bacillota bacterium]
MHYSRSLGKKRYLAAFVMLFLLAFLGNYFHLDLLPGVEILFGSIAVLMVAVFFNPFLGAGVAFIAYGLVALDPYYLMAFTCEALFVGLAQRYNKLNLVVADLVYWLVFGIPLFWLMVNVETSVAVLLSLKILINGVANSLVVTNIIFLFTLNGGKVRLAGKVNITLRYLLLNLLVALVMGSNLVYSYVQSKGNQSMLDGEINIRLESTGEHEAGYLYQWKQVHQFVLEELARIANEVGIISSDRLQDKVEDIERAWPDLEALFVCDDQGTVIAHSSVFDHHAKNYIGQNFGDREYFQMIKKTGKPFVSSVFNSRRGPDSPVVVVALPLLENQRFVGGIVGGVDLKYSNSILSTNESRFAINTSVLDRHGKIIATTRPDLRITEPYVALRGGTLRSGSNGFEIWRPDSAFSQYEVVRWLNEIYVKKIQLEPTLPWSIVLEEQTRTTKSMIIRSETQHLVILLLMLILATVAAELVSRRLSQPISYLAELTTGLPDRIADKNQKQWPSSSIFEINSLVSNFASMADTMENTFIALRESVERYQEEKERALITLYSIGDGVIVTDEEGLVEYLNPVAEQLTGWISKEAAGRRLPEIFRITNEITGENADNPVEKCLKENNVVVLTEPTTLTRNDGHMFAIEKSAAPIKNRDAKIIGV